jgi:hypothetical protein
MYKVKVTLTAKHTPSELAKKYKTSYDKVSKALEKGIKVEKEHTKNRLVAKKIALDHLNEDLGYYTKLRKIERKFKK